MRLIVLVIQSVLVIRLLEGEGLIADVAFVRHFSGMQPLVFLQEILCGKHFTAHVALPLFAFVSFQVLSNMLLLENQIVNNLLIVCNNLSLTLNNKPFENFCHKLDSCIHSR